MFVKILIHKQNNADLKIKNFLENIDEPFQIITTNNSLNYDLKNHGFDTKTLYEIFPYDDPQTIKTHVESSKILLELKDIFKDIKFRDFYLFSTLEHQILNDLILFSKFKNIIEKNVNTIFIISKLTFSHIAIKNHFFKSNNKLNIEILNSFEILSDNKINYLFQKHQNKLTYLFNKLFK